MSPTLFKPSDFDVILRDTVSSTKRMKEDRKNIKMNLNQLSKDLKGFKLKFIYEIFKSSKFKVVTHEFVNEDLTFKCVSNKYELLENSWVIWFKVKEEPMILGMMIEFDKMKVTITA